MENTGLHVMVKYAVTDTKQGRKRFYDKRI